MNSFPDSSTLRSVWGIFSSTPPLFLPLTASPSGCRLVFRLNLKTHHCSQLSLSGSMWPPLGCIHAARRKTSRGLLHHDRDVMIEEPQEGGADSQIATFSRLPKAKSTITSKRALILKCIASSVRTNSTSSLRYCFPYCLRIISEKLFKAKAPKM